MSSTRILLAFFGFATIAFCTLRFSGAQQPAQDEGAKARIVPIVVLKAGESKEILLSTSCTVDINRSGGLDIREIGTRERRGFTSSKTWKRDGVVVELPSYGQATKLADSPEYAPLKQKGIQPFVVKVAAEKDAKAGVYDLHIADYTCNGTCQTDFRVFVTEP